VTIVGTNPDAVIGGVDTHAEVHVAAAINHVGGVLVQESRALDRHIHREARARIEVTELVQVRDLRWFVPIASKQHLASIHRCDWCVMVG
jgi:hypothetical protein